MVARLFSKQQIRVRFPLPAFMKMFNKFKIWFGKKLIDIGFNSLLKMNEYDWNPKQQRYPGSVKQLKYLVNSWLVTAGMRIESKALDKSGWVGFNPKYFDKNFHLNPKFKYKRRKNDKGYDDFTNFFPDWQ